MPSGSPGGDEDKGILLTPSYGAIAPKGKSCLFFYSCLLQIWSMSFSIDENRVSLWIVFERSL